MGSCKNPDAKALISENLIRISGNENLGISAFKSLWLQGEANCEDSWQEGGGGLSSTSEFEGDLSMGPEMTNQMKEQYPLT